MEKIEVKRIVGDSGYLENEHVFVTMEFKEDRLEIITVDRVKSCLDYRKIMDVECGHECCFFLLPGDIKLFVGRDAISLH